MDKRYEEQVLNDGIDTAGEELVAMGGVDRVVNGEFRRDGGITRRRGFVRPTAYEVSGDDVTKAGHTLLANGASLAVMRKFDVATIQEGGGGGVTDRTDFALPGVVSTAVQLRNAAGFANANVAVGLCGGVLVACVVGDLAGASEGAGTTCQAVIVEVDSGVELSRESFTGQRPVPAYVDPSQVGKFHVFYRTNAAADIRVVTWSSDTNAWSGTASLLGGETASANTFPAICRDPASSESTIVAFADVGETEIHVRRVSAVRTITSSWSFNVTEVEILAMAPSASGAQLHFVYSLINGASVRMLGNSIGAVNITAEETLFTRSSGDWRWRQLSVADIGAVVGGSGVVAAACETHGLVTGGNVHHRDADYSLAGSPLLPVYSLNTASADENLYMLSEVMGINPDDALDPNGAATQPALLMARVTDVPTEASRLTTTHGFLQVLPYGSYFTAGGSASRLGAATLSGSSYGGAADGSPASYARHRPTRVVYDSASRSYFAAVLDFEEAPTSGNIIFGIRVLRYRFSTRRDDVVPLPRAQLGELTYVGGALVRCFDGARVRAAGPYHPPQAPTLAETTGGSLELLGTYTVQAVLLREDAKGLIHRSAPSPAAAFTLSGANNALTATFDLDVFPQDGESGDALRLEVYRSTADGTSLFLDQTVDVFEGAGNKVVTITAPDASIDANKLVYVTGDVLPNEAPPAAQAFAAVGNRLFGISAVDPRTIYFSKELEEGFAAEFNAVLSFRLESSVSEPVALGAIDDLLVIFTHDEAWAVSTHGGPNALGAGTFGIPQRLSSDCGASSAESVVSTPFGILVCTDVGFRLLARDGASDVPATVDLATNEALRSLHVPEREEAWFVIRGDSVGGRLVVFSYARGKVRWVTHELTGFTVRDIVNKRGQVWLLGTDSNNEYELRYVSATSYADTAGRPTLKVRTRWFKPEGHLGDARFWKLHVFATYGATDGLEADVFVMDVGGSPIDDTGGTDYLEGTYSWPKGTLDNDDRLVHVQQRLSRQRGAAARVELRLVDETGSDVVGPVLHVVGWDYGVRGGGAAKRGAAFNAEDA